MADKPANAGISGGLAGDLALPPAVHHSDYPRPIPGYRPAPAPAPAYRPEPPTAPYPRPEPAAAPPWVPDVPAYRPEPAAAPHLRPEAGGHRRHGASRARTRAARSEAVARSGAAARPEAAARSEAAARPEAAARSEAAARPEAAERPPRPSWLAYLLVLAGVAIGMVIASYSSRDALTGIAVIAGTLLAAGLARLVLPPRYAGPLCTRSRTYDVLALTVLGGSVLAIVLTLP
jgi:non-ribosomal peptide synthetase component F